jgi:hypothetical protein
MNRAQILEQIQETREKLQELEKELESCKLKKFRIILDVETNPDDWGCEKDGIVGVLRSYLIESLTEIKELTQLVDPDDSMTLKDIYEIKD